MSEEMAEQNLFNKFSKESDTNFTVMFFNWDDFHDVVNVWDLEEFTSSIFHTGHNDMHQKQIWGAAQECIDWILDKPAPSYQKEALKDREFQEACRELCLDIQLTRPKKKAR